MIHIPKIKKAIKRRALNYAKRVDNAVYEGLTETNMKTIKEFKVHRIRLDGTKKTKVYLLKEDVSGLIDERLKCAFKRLEFCRTHKTTYYRNEEMRALSIINELEELKKRING